MNTIKTFLETVSAAFSMFSKLPQPRIEWEKENMRFVMAAFPLVGVAVGALETLWLFISRSFLPGVIPGAALLTAIPLLVTGGIHMDGFCDVSDARASYGDAEKKQAILRDPHIGAFAAIRLAVYTLLYFGAAAAFYEHSGSAIMLLLLHVLSRSISGLSVVTLKISAESGLAKTFSSLADKRATGRILAVEAAVCMAALAAAGAFWKGFPGFLTAVGCILAVLLCRPYLARVAEKEFGGLSGDLCGWFLQNAELAGLIILALGGWIK